MLKDVPAAGGSQKTAGHVAEMGSCLATLMSVP